MFKKVSSKVMAAGAVVAASANSAFAAAADPATIVSASTTIFESVTVLTVAAVGFGIAVRLIKGIRK